MMRTNCTLGAHARLCGCAITAGLVFLLGCAPKPQPVEQPAEALFQAPSAPPEYSINQVMVALVDHAGHVLWDVGREGMAPKSDRDWEEIEHHAIQLIAAGTLITVGGTGQADPGWVRQLPWQEQARQLTNAGLAALEAAHGKNLEGVLNAGDRLIEACEACHKEYKPEMPSEGVFHSH